MVSNCNTYSCALRSCAHPINTVLLFLPHFRHLGLLYDWMTPRGRGFDSSLGYLAGGEDHYTQYQQRAQVFGCTGTDLYDTDSPAIGRNGTYGAFIYGQEVRRVIEAHDRTRPLFMYLAPQVMHAPQEVPSRFKALYAQNHSDDYAIMNGMASAADELLGNATAALKAKGMWNNTLIIATSDNGGPAGRLSSGSSGNNWPLRGGKTNFFEGGVRVTAWVGGGFVPQRARGASRTGYIHAADWYPTLLRLAGVNASDGKSTVPEIDGVDQWDYVVGDTAAPPRSEIMLGTERVNGTWNGALISGSYKLVLGWQSYSFWQSPNYPNASTDHKAEQPFNCGDTGCLFNIQQDPGEHHDLARAEPDTLARLQALFARRNATAFQAPKIENDAVRCKAYVKANQGFLGPYMGSE